MADDINPAMHLFWRRVMALTLVAIIITAIVFLTSPQFDLVVERLFYSKANGFLLNQYSLIGQLRSAIIFSYGVWYVTLVVMLVIIILQLNHKTLAQPLRQKHPLALKRLIYLVTTSLIGPLLLANIILKNNWGRARPRQVVEFGGSQEFSAPLLMSDQCQTNCSFVSGEPSSMFMIFLSLAFIIPNHRKLLVATAIITGTLSGLMRMGQGGHFLSDVIFAGLFMALCAASLYWLIFLSKLGNKMA